jgi:hypothetical protein
MVKYTVIRILSLQEPTRNRKTLQLNDVRNAPTTIRGRQAE